MPGKLKQIWKVRLDSWAHDTVACGRRIFTRVDDRVLCFLPSGRPAWERRLPDPDGWPNLLAHGDRVYVPTDPVLTLDPVSGRTLASRSLGPWPALRSSGPWLTCWAGTAGRFLVIDPETLQTVLEVPDETGSHSLHEGLLCTRRGVEHVISDPWTGDEIARLSEMFYLHVHYRDCVCLFGDEHRVALDLGTGRVTWQRQTPGPVRELRFDPGQSVTISTAGFTEWPLRLGDLAVCRGRALSGYDLRTGELAWRSLENSSPSHWALTADGLIHIGGRSMHLVESWSGRVLGSSPPLERELRRVAGLRGGLTVAECLTYTGYACELRGFALEDDTAPVEPAEETE